MGWALGSSVMKTLWILQLSPVPKPLTSPTGVFPYGVLVSWKPADKNQWRSPPCSKVSRSSIMLEPFSEGKRLMACSNGCPMWWAEFHVELSSQCTAHPCSPRNQWTISVYQLMDCHLWPSFNGQVFGPPQDWTLKEIPYIGWPPLGNIAVFRFNIYIICIVIWSNHT